MHIAIVPDGNRRWAKEHGVPPLQGHVAGAEVMHTVVEYLIDHQVKHLTAWGFSADNWKRSDSEVSALFHLLATWIEKDTPWLHGQGVRLHYIGRLQQLPDYLQLTMNNATELTSGNTGMTLTLAFNYSGRAEIVDAVRRLIDAGLPREIDEEFLSQYLDTNGMPDVDLVIRTAGEFRLSNFLLWQTAYSEFFFSEVLWPDFDTKELEKALDTYSERKRRFGGD